jgi:formylglycine-generating enzyme required for sulfatase activity
MLAIGKLLEDIDRRGGGQNLLLVDACREDPARGRGLDGGKVTALPEGLAVLFGCRAGEKTFESKNAGGGHGVLFHFVLDGLRGAAKNDEGEITWDRLTEYVRRRVSRETSLLVGDATIKQNPNLIANLPGESPVLLWPRAGRPKLLIAPFDESGARAAQQAWAQYGGKPGFIEENSLGMKLTLIPPGEFSMGSDDAEADQLVKDYPWLKREWFQGERQHRVRITKPYYLGAHEVTVGQFRKFVEAVGHKTDAESSAQGGWGYDAAKIEFERKPGFSWKNTGWPQSDNQPVVNVSWNDAQAFCKWLSEKEGRTYRLATEAEWEYACRAGTTSRHSGGSKETVTEFGNIADARAHHLSQLVLREGERRPRLHRAGWSVQA